MPVTAPRATPRSSRAETQYKPVRPEEFALQMFAAIVSGLAALLTPQALLAKKRVAPRVTLFE